MNAETKIKKDGSAKADRATRQSRSQSSLSPPDGASVPAASIYARLAAEFPRDAIHWRSQKLTQTGNKALALAYLDARDVQDRLDQVCTPAGWRNTIVETPKGRVLSTIEILIDGQWIGKCDGAGDTAVEGDKGGISDAFKRSAVLWGIGRYLYRLPTVWAPCESSEYPQGSGKRYFKKWLGSPWDQVPASWNASTYADLPAHDPATGEIIEAKGPEGISGIKDRLRELKVAGNAAETLDDFNTLIRASADDLNVIKADNHDWWAGDGVEDEGFKAWILRRRAELSSAETLGFQMLVSCVKECTSSNELRAFLNKHGDAVGALDGAESRRFEAIYDEKAAALKLLDQTTVGA